MNTYRIIRRGRWFFPQRRVWGLFWVDVDNVFWHSDNETVGRATAVEAIEDCKRDARGRRKVKPDVVLVFQTRGGHA